MDPILIKKILVIILGAVFLVKFYFSIKSGRTFALGSTYFRAQQPRSFLLTNIRDIVLGLLLIVFSIYA